MKTQFEGACPTPSAAGDHQGTRGGYPLGGESVGGGGALRNSPFESPICPTPSGQETAGGELGTAPATYAVEGAPGRDGTVAPGLITDHQSNHTFKG